jgi:hypothetical protein
VLESLTEQPIAATNSSQRGLCHGKKSELESLAEQTIAATNSSQNTLPVAHDPLASSTLPAALDPLASSTLPAALDPSASSIMLAALDPSADPLLSATLDSRSANTTNFSAALDLHSACCFNSNKTCSAFQLVANEHKGLFNCKTASTFKLIFGFKQQYQRQLQQDLVDLSLSNAFSIAKLDLISIKARANSAKLINAPMSQESAMIHLTTAVPNLLSNTCSCWVLREHTQPVG